MSFETYAGNRHRKFKSYYISCRVIFSPFCQMFSNNSRHNAEVEAFVVSLISRSDGEMICGIETNYGLVMDITPIYVPERTVECFRNTVLPSLYSFVIGSVCQQGNSVNAHRYAVCLLKHMPSRKQEIEQLSTNYLYPYMPSLQKELLTIKSRQSRLSDDQPIRVCDHTSLL